MGSNLRKGRTYSARFRCRTALSAYARKLIPFCGGAITIEQLPEATIILGNKFSNLFSTVRDGRIGEGA
jgi:hypothetical protein